MSTLARFALLLCLFTAAGASTGCGPTVQDRLVGSWKGTLELNQAALDEKMAAAKNPLEAFAAQSLLKMVQGQAKFDLDLNADGTTAMFMTGGTKTTGKWELKSAEGQQATIVITESQPREYVITLDENFMSGEGGFSVPTWGPIEGLGTLRFQRAAAN